MTEEEKWERRLEKEGLGVIEVDAPYSGVDIKQIKGKWARLDAAINDLKSPSEYMTNSPVTADGTESHVHIHQGGMPRGWEGNTLWDDFVLSFTATSKEAEIAYRARGTILGLDNFNRPIRPKQSKRLTARQRVENSEAKRLGLAIPHPTNPFITEMPCSGSNTYCSEIKYDYFKKEQGLPCAHSDGGNGPLSIIGCYQPPKGGGPCKQDEEPIRMAPLVDTMYYLPGRSPFQMSRYVANNSDITG